ncbi:hypothetical protein [Bacteriophage sp.]|nr:hypothetical protein [Caudoviricetes sp.]UOF80010.1 hypothetical protein [Bacteriophage sp.]
MFSRIAKASLATMEQVTRVFVISTFLQSDECGLPRPTSSLGLTLLHVVIHAHGGQSRSRCTTLRSQGARWRGGVADLLGRRRRCSRLGAQRDLQATDLASGCCRAHTVETLQNVRVLGEVVGQLWTQIAFQDSFTHVIGDRGVRTTHHFIVVRCLLAELDLPLGKRPGTGLSHLAGAVLFHTLGNGLFSLPIGQSIDVFIVLLEVLGDGTLGCGLGRRLRPLSDLFPVRCFPFRLAASTGQLIDTRLNAFEASFLVTFVLLAFVALGLLFLRLTFFSALGLGAGLLLALLRGLLAGFLGRGALRLVC